MASVKLQLGNLFDEPSDLIVLPCSTERTVTNFVAAYLEQYGIPGPDSMELGRVDVQPCDHDNAVSPLVAFAASVQDKSSSTTAIANIGAALGQATGQNQAIRRVSAPLLGTGAGGLRAEEVVEALGNGFKREAAEEAVLTVFVQDRNVLDRLGG